MRKKHISLLITFILLIIGVVYIYFKFFSGLGGGKLAENIEMELYSDTLLKKIPVALDVSVDEKLYVVETSRFFEGVGDNRAQSFWLLDDLASEHIDDRLAYIKKWIALGELTDDWFFNETDAITVLEDVDKDGVGDKATNFDSTAGYLDGVIASILLVDDHVYVANIPHIFRYTDADGDLIPEEKLSLSEGYGLRTNFVGHDLHGLVWGPDGKIYYSVGDRGYNLINQEGKHLKPLIDEGRGAVFRMNPDGSELEVFAQGLRNPQELAFDNYGNLFTGDNNSDGGDAARIVYVVEGGDSGWMSPYQYQTGSYLRGAWNAERLWFLQYENQAAWILPPIAHLINGPSGFDHYPGLGFSERYNDYFFVSNYSFSPAWSNMWSFGVREKGAGFSVEDAHIFADQELFINQQFSYEGTLYAVAASVWNENTKVLRLLDSTQKSDPYIASNKAIWLKGLANLESSELIELLSNRDQRMRLQAQFELAKRNEVVLLQNRFNQKEVSSDDQTPNLEELARIHALWGLGQIGTSAFVDESWAKLDWLVNENDEIKSQVFKVLGEAGFTALSANIALYISDSNKRVAYFAALAISKLNDTEAHAGILEALEKNQDQDVFLRHALVLALNGVSNTQSLQALSSHSSRSVRLAAVLALRKRQAPEIKLFLKDQDDYVVLEVVRAIHDLPIEGAMEALAELVVDPRLSEAEVLSKNPFVQLLNIISAAIDNIVLVPEFFEVLLKADFGNILNEMYSTANVITSETGQSTYAFQRRIINANLIIGDEASAKRLSQYVLDESKPELMRELALDAIQNFSQPPLIDAVLGRYQKHSTRDISVLTESLDLLIPQLIKDAYFSEAALDLAIKYKRMPFPQAVLFEKINDSKSSDTLRIVSLKALAEKAQQENNYDLLNQSILIAKNSSIAALRAEALDISVHINPENALGEVKKVLENKNTIIEKQRAIALLANIKNSHEILLSLVEKLNNRSLENALMLDVMEVFKQTEFPELKNAYKDFQSKQAQLNVIEQRAYSLAGGDARRGEIIFESNGDCIRCHKVNNKGGVVGPDLSNISDDYDSNYLLTALVEPAKDIAPGFGLLVLNMKDGTTKNGILVKRTKNGLVLNMDSGHGSPVELNIANEDIASESDMISGMPPMGLILPPQDLRDLMAYLTTL